MKYIVTGGGTGGHIYPAISMAQMIKEQGHDVLYVGAQRGMEKELVPPKKIDLILLPVGPMNKKRPFKSVYNLFKSLYEARKILKREKPCGIIGTGGYASWPMMYMGQKMKIDTYIHEQNAFPGKANLALAKGAKTVMTTFEGSDTYFPEKVNLRVTGLPVLEAFISTKPEDAKKKLGLPQDSFLVVSVGGTNGAKKIHDTMFEVYEAFKSLKKEQRDKLVFIHVAGKVYEKKIMDQVNSGEMTLDDHVKVIGFCDDMPTMINAADLVISRAGASTMMELIATKTPSIIIPSPNVANNHQVYNAKIVEQKGIGCMIEEKNLKAEGLLRQILALCEDQDALYTRMQEHYKQLPTSDPKAEIKEVLGL